MKKRLFVQAKWMGICMLAFMMFIGPHTDAAQRFDKAAEQIEYQIAHRSQTIINAQLIYKRMKLKNEEAQIISRYVYDDNAPSTITNHPNIQAVSIASAEVEPTPGSSTKLLVNIGAEDLKQKSAALGSETEPSESTAAQPVQVLPTVEVVATGYYAGVESTGKDPRDPDYGITYSGVKVRRDTVSTVAADTEVFPIGTLLLIPGYGYGVVADTGSAIKGKKLDLYFETKAKVYEQWGKKTVKVTVIHKGDGKITEQMLNDLNEVYADKPIPPSSL